MSALSADIADLWTAQYKLANVRVLFTTHLYMAQKFLERLKKQ